MIKFEFFGTEIDLDFTFFAVLALFFFFDSGTGFCAFLSCMFHELGHLIVMRIFNIPTERLTFYGGGIQLSTDIGNRSCSVRIAVLSAGCVFNLLLAAVLFLCGAKTVAAVNMFICLFNLLPVSHLDGGRLAAEILHHFCEPYKADHLLCLLRVVVITATAVCIILTGTFPDITLFVFVLYCVTVSACCRK